MININLIEKHRNAKKPFGFKRTLKKIVNEAAKLNNIKKPISLSLIIIDDKEMTQLNIDYKKRNKTTDILSFADDFEAIYKLTGETMLGDIFISYDQLLNNASKYKHSLKREWYYLFAHGVLHLMGHDHMNKKEEDIMNEQANKIMQVIKMERK